jgi:hypothetical protein
VKVSGFDVCLSITSLASLGEGTGAGFVCLVQPAHAEWVSRIDDGIMGTRMTVGSGRTRPRRESGHRRCAQRDDASR